MFAVTYSAAAAMKVRRPIRVVFCIDSTEIGGTELNAVRTAERLDRTRFELSVACMRSGGPLEARYTAAGIPVLSFPIPSLYSAEALWQGQRLASFFRARRIDVVHAHDRYSNTFAVPWARFARVPAVIASRRWWNTHPKPVLRVSNWAAYRLAHAVLTNSPAVARLVEQVEGIPSRRIAVVPNFLDEEAFASPTDVERARLRAELGIAEDVPVVGVVANLRPIKDHATLLRAVAGLGAAWSQVQLVLIGEGESRPLLEQLARDLGIQDRVRFAGRRNNRPNLHHLFDISVLSSLSEGFPNSVLEAMAAARPVVATAVGGTVDAVVGGETGLLVPPSDPVRLGAALEHLLAEPEQARRMGLAGLRRAREEFSAEAVLAILESLYERLVWPAERGDATATGRTTGAHLDGARPVRPELHF